MFVKSFPYVGQLDGMDCGPACLAMIAQWHGKKYDLKGLRERAFITRQGVNMTGLSLAAESIGFRTLGVKLTLDNLINKAHLPCIVHWDQRHFIVVYKISRKRAIHKPNRIIVHVADPAHGLIVYGEHEFCEKWINSRGKGFALFLEPTPSFHEMNPDKDAQKRFRFPLLFKYLYGHTTLIIQVLIGLLLASCIQLIFPFLTQAIVDHGIGDRDIKFIYLILYAQMALVIGRSAVEFVRRWILLHIGTRINISVISDFLSKLMKLPISFFDKKLTGDLMQRIGDHNKIEIFLTETLLTLVFSLMNLLIFSIVLIIYSPLIFSVFLAGSLLNALWVYAFMKERADLEHKNFVQMSHYQGNIMQIIQGMQEIKLTGSEQQKKWEWSSIQAELYKIKMKSMTVGQWQQGGAIFINEIKNIIVTVISASYGCSFKLFVSHKKTTKFNAFLNLSPICFLQRNSRKGLRTGGFVHRLN